ncbi:MAG: hypothetical protein ACLRVU_02860 [Beduini sp.]
MHFWKRAFVRAWLYCEVKKGTADVRKKNQNPVWKRSGLDGGYGRGISELLPPMVAAEEDGAEEQGYREESYEAWCDGTADDRGIPDIDAGSLEELVEKKMMLDVLEEAMESLLPNERELAEKVFGEDMSVCEYARLKGENRRTLAFRKGKVLDKLRDFFEDKGIEL